MDNDQERRDAAISRLRSRREFTQHAMVYLAVNALLVIIWAVSGAGYFWPVWAIGGWGIGLLAHAWRVWGERPFTDEEILEETRRF